MIVRETKTGRNYDDSLDNENVKLTTSVMLKIFLIIREKHTGWVLGVPQKSPLAKSRQVRKKFTVLSK